MILSLYEDRLMAENVSISKPGRLTRAQAADYLGLAPSTLARWACNGRYRLPYYLIGNRAMYDVDDLDELCRRNRKTFPIGGWCAD